MMNINQDDNKLINEQQEQPYTIQNIDAKISTLDHAVQVQNIIFQINQTGITLLKQLQQQKWQTVFASFMNTTSMGINKTKLMIFIGDNQIQEDQQEPIILQLNHQEPLNIILNNSNNYIIELQFSKLGSNVMNEVHGILTNKMNEADQNNSRYDDDQQFQEMISADQIDQNGNILSLNKNKDGEKQQQDDKDMQEQIEEEQEK